MWAVWIVVGLSALMFAAALLPLWRAWRAASLPWQILACSGIPLALGGLGFAMRFWHPTPGPYLANVRYPFGSHLNAWAVSFGFMWLAFGLLFFLAACAAPRTARVWFGLLTAWCLAWLPHVLIGVAATAAGGNAPSFERYRQWGSSWSGALILFSSSIILILHFGLSLLGFGLTARELRKRHGESAARGVGRSA
jgi:hypothetical protein